MRDIDPETIKNLAVEMTARTGELWRIVEHPDKWPHIESPTACLTVRESWKTKRIEIQATAPHGTREPHNGQTITCDPTRKPEAIARDIENRILAHARKHLQESIQFDLERTKDKNRINLRRELFKKWMPKTDHNGDPYGEGIKIYFTYDGRAKLTLELSLKDALQLLKERY